MEVERDALMQQLQAQLKDAVEQVEKEVTVGQVEFSKKINLSDTTQIYLYNICTNCAVTPCENLENSSALNLSERS